MQGLAVPLYGLIVQYFVFSPLFMLFLLISVQTYDKIMPTRGDDLIETNYI